jgi:hypothetical protein
MSGVVDKEKLKADAGLEYLPTDMTLVIRRGISGEDEFWRYQWEDKPHRLVYSACCEAERLAAEVETLKALIEALKRDLRAYEAEADAPTICEGATE